MFVCFLYPQKKWNLGKKLNQFNHGHERKSSLFLKFIQFVWSDFWSSTRDRTYSQMYTYVYRIIYTLDICVFKHSHLNILVFFRDGVSVGEFIFDDVFSLPIQMMQFLQISSIWGNKFNKQSFSQNVFLRRLPSACLRALSAAFEEKCGTVSSFHSVYEEKFMS